MLNLEITIPYLDPAQPEQYSLRAETLKDGVEYY